jgi:hypothetical protein
MKSRWITVALCLVAVIVVIARLIPHGRSRGETGSPHATRPAAATAYLGLRSLVLEGTRANFGLGPGSSATQPFAVVSDWSDPEGTTTIIAIADGSASVYHSNGAASIGGGQSHESIRDAALKAVEAAAVLQPQMHPTSEFPLPSGGQVSFYVVTDEGVFTATAAQDDLVNNRSPFSPLAAAAQSIVSEYQHVAPGR